MKLQKYETLTPEEIAQHFLNISRQRISQVVQHYSKLEDLTTFLKLCKAKVILKQLKRDEKTVILALAMLTVLNDEKLLS